MPAEQTQSSAPSEQDNCRFCGLTFERPVGKKGPRQIYCSKACNQRASQARATAAKQEERRAQLRPCPTCGKFPELKAGGPLPKFCSHRCNDIARGAVLAEPYPDRVCPLEECGVTFTPKYKHQRCCSERHGKTLCNREGRKAGKYRPDPWSDRRRDNYHRRRALKRQTETGGPVLREEIAERDDWICGLCREPVSPDVAWPDPMSASLDHIVPLSKGGGHLPENVQLAHLGCNTRKGNRT